MKKMSILGIAALSGICLSAFAAVIIDDDGLGFVGKGDVQLVYTWNNQALQLNADSVQFRATSVTEVTWECTNSNNDKIQERARTTSSTGVLTSVARLRNQITGFNLNGWNGVPTESTDGPPLNSCPSGPWTLTSPAGDPVLVGNGGGVEVSINGTNWFPVGQ